MLKRLGLLFLAFASAAFAQMPQPAPAAPTLHYEVVSIRESKPDPHGFRMMVRGDDHGSHKEIDDYDYRNLLGLAFGLYPWQMDPLPASTDTNAMYIVHLSSGEETDAALKAMTDDQAKEAHQRMLQEVLAERFHLKYHWVTREMPSFLLTTGKQVKMQASAVTPPAPGAKIQYNQGGPDGSTLMTRCGQQGCTIEGHGVPMEQLATMTSYQLRGIVADKTGLPGLWDFKLEYSWKPVQAGTDDSQFPPIEVALSDQLGLKVERSKAPAKILVVDHIEPPTPN